MKIESKLRLRGRVQVSVRQADKIVKVYPWQNNLILDQGMDKIASVLFNQLFASCAAGNSTDPTVFVPPQGTTYTLSGTTATANNPVFDTSMLQSDIVGAASGRRHKISAIIGTAPSTQATVVQGGSIVDPVAFTVEYVNQAILGNELARTSIYLTTPRACESIVAPGNITLQRTFLFPAETIDTTYSELGLSDQPLAGANLFSRILLNNPVVVQGPSAELPAGQQLQVLYQLIVTFDYGQGAGNFFPGVTNETVNVVNLPIKWQIFAYANSSTVPGNLAVSVVGKMPGIVGQQIHLTGSSVPAYNGAWPILDRLTFTDPTHGASTIFTLQLPFTTIPADPTASDTLHTDLRGGFFRACQGIYLVGSAGQSMVPANAADHFLGYGEPSVLGHGWAAGAGPSFLGGNGAPVRVTGNVNPINDIDCNPPIYTPGNFYVDQQADIPIAASENISSFGYGLPDDTNQIETFFWNQPQALAGSSTLSLIFRLSWAR